MGIARYPAFSRRSSPGHLGGRYVPAMARANDSPGSKGKIRKYSCAGCICLPVRRSERRGHAANAALRVYQGETVIRGLTFAMIIATLTALSAASSPATAPTSAAPAFVNTLMPQPSQLSAQEGRLAITPSFTAGTDQFRDARLDEAIGRSLDRIKTRTATLISKALAADKATATLVVSVD